MRISRKLEARVFGKMLLFKFFFQSMNIPREETMGLSARVKHSTEYVIFLDFDVIKDEPLIEMLRYLQERYHVGDFHVLTTNQYGRHAVCCDRLPCREVLAVMEDCPCDQLFKKGIRLNEYRTWILRFLEKGNRPKPKYLYSVKSPYNGQNLQSEAHAIFLRDFYGAKVRLTNPDGNITLETQSYKTSNMIDVKDLVKKYRKLMEKEKKRRR